MQQLKQENKFLNYQLVSKKVSPGQGPQTDIFSKLALRCLVTEIDGFNKILHLVFNLPNTNSMGFQPLCSALLNITSSVCKVMVVFLHHVSGKKVCCIA